jgi:uncharacterized protein involved in outer membrane biogenesis
MSKRRRRPFLRALLGAIVLLAVAVLGASLAATLLIDPNAFKPRIAAAVARATGRTLALHGPIRLGFGLPPRFVAEDVALANAPGGSRPDMLHLARIEARIALLPLLAGEVDIVRLDLVRPDLLLETDAAGRGNWRFAPAPPATTSAPAAPKSAAPAQRASRGRFRFAIETVHVVDGRVTWHDGRSGQAATLLVPSLDASAAAPGASLVLAGNLISNGRSFVLSGETGPAERLLDRASDAPWPLELALQGEGARLAVRGTLTMPLRSVGYALQVDAAATDLAAFAPFIPVPLPRLHDATFTARITDNGTGRPELSGIALHIAGLDLGAIRPGLAIARADLTAPDLNHPAEVDLQASLAAAVLHVRARIGSLAGLLPAAPAGTAVPVQVAAVTAAGQGAAPLQFTAALEIARAPRPTVRGSVAAQRVDLDALLAAFAPPPAAVPPAAPPSPPSPPPAAPAPGRLIADRPIDFAPLRAFDADLQLSTATLQTGGITYSDLAGHFVLNNGRLVLDPFSGQTPGGRMDGRLSVDAAEAGAPSVSLLLRAPAIALGPFATALGYGGALDGIGAIDADLRASGATAHALASTLSGRLAVTMNDADVDNALLAAMLGNVLKAARIPEAALGGKVGRTRLRCFDLRLEATNGTATVTALGLDAGRFALQGGGTVELGSETLNLHLRPLVHIGPGVIVPVRVRGTLADPKPALDAAGAARTALEGAPAGTGCGTAGEGEPAKPPKPIDVLRGLLAH